MKFRIKPWIVGSSGLTGWVVERKKVRFLGFGIWRKVDERVYSFGEATRVLKRLQTR